MEVKLKLDTTKLEKGLNDVKKQLVKIKDNSPMENKFKLEDEDIAFHPEEILGYHFYEMLKNSLNQTNERIKKIVKA